VLYGIVEHMPQMQYFYPEKTTLIIDADTGNEVDGMKRDFFKSVSEYFSKGNSPGE